MQYINEGCGCPEEKLIIGMAEVIIHLEPNGTGEAFIYMGEWEEEKTFDCTTMEELKKKTEEYIFSLPADNR